MTRPSLLGYTPLFLASVMSGEKTPERSLGDWYAQARYPSEDTSDWHEEPSSCWEVPCLCSV